LRKQVPSPVMKSIQIKKLFDRLAAVNGRSMKEILTQYKTPFYCDSAFVTP